MESNAPSGLQSTNGVIVLPPCADMYLVHGCTGCTGYSEQKILVLPSTVFENNASLSKYSVLAGRYGPLIHWLERVTDIVKTLAAGVEP